MRILRWLSPRLHILVVQRPETNPKLPTAVMQMECQSNTKMKELPLQLTTVNFINVLVMDLPTMKGISESEN